MKTLSTGTGHSLPTDQSRRAPDPKWTPGPWKNCEDGYIEAEDGSLIVEQINNDISDFEDDTTITANADLIAAAPDLYAALRRLLPAARACKHENFSNIAGEEDTLTNKIDAAIAALSKAHGIALAQSTFPEVPSPAVREKE